MASTFTQIVLLIGLATPLSVAQPTSSLIEVPLLSVEVPLLSVPPSTTSSSSEDPSSPVTTSVPPPTTSSSTEASSSSVPPPTTSSSTEDPSPFSSCLPNTCCIAQIDGLEAKLCLKNGTIESLTAPESTKVMIQPSRPVFRLRSRTTSRFAVGSIKILNLNVWGFEIWAEDKKERLDAIAEHIEKENYDLVFIQELWYNRDFQQIKNTFPYSTYYGTPYSLKCPSISNDKQYFFQFAPVDCNGLTILSRTPLDKIQYEFFNDRAFGTQGMQFREYFAQRGLLRTRTIIDGKKVSLINTHLATWHSETEDTWSHVREAQADQVIGMVKAEEKEADLVIVSGDMNSQPTSPVMKKMAGAGLKDSVKELKGSNAEEAEYSTWGNPANSYTVEEEDMRIDYVMYKGVSGSYKVTSAGILALKTDVDGKLKSVSDHMGVEVVIKIV